MAKKQSRGKATRAVAAQSARSRKGAKVKDLDVKSGRDVLQIFREQMNLPDERLKLILNQRQPTTLVPVEAVERTIGRPVNVMIGHDGNRPDRAVLAGTVLVVSEPRSEIARGVRKLTELIGVGAAAGENESESAGAGAAAGSPASSGEVSE